MYIFSFSEHWQDAPKSFSDEHTKKIADVTMCNALIVTTLSTV